MYVTMRRMVGTNRRGKKKARGMKKMKLLKRVLVGGQAIMKGWERKRKGLEENRI